MDKEIELFVRHNISHVDGWGIYVEQREDSTDISYYETVDGRKVVRNVIEIHFVEMAAAVAEAVADVVKRIKERKRLSEPKLN